MYVFDVETFKNFHSAVFKHTETNEYHEFVIHESRNDLKEYVRFVKQAKVLIGFNNQGYDDPVIHYIVDNEKVFSNMKPEDITELIYYYSTSVILSDFRRVRAKDYLYTSIDLYKLHHFDNVAKATSLKKLEVNLRHESIEDLPYKPDHMVSTDQIDIIMSYNRNDVDVTQSLFEKSRKMLRLRHSLGKKYGLELLSHNDVKLGVTIAKEVYKEYSGLQERDFIDKRTPRYEIYIDECIPDNVEFKTPYMQNILKEFRSQVVNGTKGSFKLNVTLGGNMFTLGQGGLHSKDPARIIDKKDDEILTEKDVASMYPSIIINQKIYPEHLGVDFLKGYTDIYHQRLGAKRTEKLAKAEGRVDEKAAVMNAGLKLALNGKLKCAA